MAGISLTAMIAAYLLDPGKRQYDLDILAAEWLKMEVSPTKNSSEREYRENICGCPFTKSCRIWRDCVTPGIDEGSFAFFRNATAGTLFDKVELPLVTVLGDLEWHGMLIDTEFLKTSPSSNMEYWTNLQKRFTGWQEDL